MHTPSLQSLLSQYREDGFGQNRAQWLALSQEFFASSQRPPVLNALGNNLSVVLHGSTSCNVADEHSDLDYFLFLDEEGLRTFDTLCPARFVEVTINGKIGHMNATPFSFLEDTLTKPNFEIIYELQHAAPVLDPKNLFAPYAKRAQQPMHQALRRAALLFNYVEMRSFHRSADNPIARDDRLAALSSIVETINYGLRCALVLDGRPFPYVKWLYLAATFCPTGTMVLEVVDRIIDLLQTDPKALLGPQKENVINQQLHLIRQIIKARAKETGIIEPWLIEWWLYFEAQRTAFDGIEWGTGD